MAVQIHVLWIRNQPCWLLQYVRYVMNCTGCSEWARCDEKEDCVCATVSPELPVTDVPTYPVTAERRGWSHTHTHTHTNTHTHTHPHFLLLWGYLEAVHRHILPQTGLFHHSEGMLVYRVEWKIVDLDSMQEQRVSIDRVTGELWGERRE